MSVLIITILMYGHPSQARFVPAIHSVEISTKNACQAARDAYLRELEPIVTELNAAIKDAKDVGDIKSPAGVIITGQCFDR
ncbi:hypothetical protein KBI52_12080 [Microvirga sp. HBU67558]|uniref:hypothetical protein n=1 Tax=Microvirga TaxID=186650 RepID=UPI001B377517|nr:MULTISPECIES: hypothetical protein [unclassified Microvirga]MBQ0820945.1 hypothetical protein [Microvirga sp. HBU67558]